MGWTPDDENTSTWKPLTPEQREELRRRETDPRLEIVREIGPSRPHGRISPPPARERKPVPSGPVLH